MTSKQKLLKMRRPGARRALRPGLIALALMVSGCGSGVHVAAPASTTPTSNGPQTYFSGSVNGETSSSLGFTNELGSYTIDDAAKTFSQSSYLFGTNLDLNTQNGPQLNYSGNMAPLARGLLGLSTTYFESKSGPVDYTPPKTGTWAIELPDRGGGLVDLTGLPFTPLVAAEACPTSSTPQNFNFVTIPTAGSGPVAAWDPQVEAAYGTVAVSGDGTSVLFGGIQQFTMDGTQIRNYSTIGITPAPVAYTSISGDCSPTFYGNTTSVTGTLSITNPGVGETVENSATLGIGPSGLLVESNGNGYTTPNGVSSATVVPTFQPFMGAGTGALGLPVPSAPLAITGLTGQQYLGFFYGFNGVESSTVASFGFTSAPASCALVTTQTATLIYGGDFTNNDPSTTAIQANGGFGNCDAAVDLGAQSATQNGLFPNATVTEGADFAGSTGTLVLPAVAIAGMLDGKFAIFLVTSTGQGVYLLQSN